MKGCVNTFFNVIQPIRTATEFADEVAYLIALTGQHMQYAYEQRPIAFKRLREQIDKEHRDLADGKLTQLEITQHAYDTVLADCNHTVEKAY